MEIVASGTIENLRFSSSDDYQIKHGKEAGDIGRLSISADREWLDFKADLFDKIEVEANGDDNIKKELYSECKLEDHHWIWSKKAFICSGDEYEWFFLTVDGHVEAVAVIYHPKPSLLSGKNIFYVDYIATAPWNRRNRFNEKKYKDCGLRLLQASLDYSINVMGYSPGFSLHSLPQSIGYYEVIGMNNLGKDVYKQGLYFFEMPEGNCESFLHRRAR